MSVNINFIARAVLTERDDLTIADLKEKLSNATDISIHDFGMRGKAIGGEWSVASDDMKLKDFVSPNLSMITSTPDSKQAVIKLRELQDMVKRDDDPSAFKVYGCDGWVMTKDGIMQAPSTSTDAVFIASYGNDDGNAGYACTTSTALPSSSAEAPEPVQIDRLTQLRLENEALRLVVKSGITLELPDTPEDFDASIVSMQKAVFKMKVHRGLHEEGCKLCVATYNLQCFTKVVPETGLTVLQFKKQALKELVGITPTKPDDKFDFVCIPYLRDGAGFTEFPDNSVVLNNNRVQVFNALVRADRWVMKITPVVAPAPEVVAPAPEVVVPAPEVEAEPQSPRTDVEDGDLIVQIMTLSDIYPDLVENAMNFLEYIHDATDFKEDCLIKIRVFETKDKHVFDLDVPITLTVDETKVAIVNHIRDILTKKGETPAENMITANDFSILHMGRAVLGLTTLEWCIDTEENETGTLPNALKFVIDLRLNAGGKRGRIENTEVEEKHDDPHFIKCLITTFKNPWGLQEWENMAKSPIVSIETLEEMREACQTAGSAEFKSQKVLECINYIRELKAMGVVQK